ncbi:MAG: ComF family protein [Ruminococcus sp.]|nr:ComF family protein [Ruminococcus sp.]
MEKIHVSPDALCRKCGKAKEECMCAVLPAYDEAIAISYYKKEAKSGLIAMKKSTSRNFGWYAGEQIGKWILEQPDWMMTDGIVPVPMSFGKRMLRGYNQAELIAKGIASVTHIPVLKNCLKKKHGYRAQHTLGAGARAENTEAFQPGGRDLRGYRLILCDDILTTGITMNRCAELLKESGAEAVYAAVAATTCRKREE